MKFWEKKNFWLAPFLFVLGIVLTTFYFYQGSLYGDKKDVLRELEANSTNKLVMDNKADLETALSVQKAIHNVAQSVSPSVVNIRTEQVVKNQPRRGQEPFDFFDFFGEKEPFGFRGPQKLQSLGSGFVISKDGYVVTNNHVVQDADKITIFFSNEKEYKGTIVGRDEKTDIAVIKIDPKEDLPVTPLGNSDEVSVGDFAIAIGNPFGLKGTFTLGVISARGRDNVDADAGLKNYIQTDASINQGNSGGPLLNIRGQAIGINTAIFSTTGGSVGIGFAIPINIVKRVVKSLIESGKVERGYLGVTISDIPEDVAKYLKVEKNVGIFVQDVERESPADKGGIKSGDIILKVDNQNLHSASELQRTISSYQGNETINIQVLRKSEKKDLKITLSKQSGEKLASGSHSDSQGGSKSSFLGLVVGSIADNYRYFRLNSDLKGVVVVQVETGSAGESAGLSPGDVIQQINYQDINTLSDFKNFISENKNKSGSFLVKIKRRGINQFVVIESE